VDGNVSGSFPTSGLILTALNFPALLAQCWLTGMYMTYVTDNRFYIPVMYLCTYIYSIIRYMLSPLAARPKACVYCRSLDGIAGSNPVGGMDMCLL
jgi:hypothetical protein